MKTTMICVMLAWHLPATPLLGESANIPDVFYELVHDLLDGKADAALSKLDAQIEQPASPEIKSLLEQTRNTVKEVTKADGYILEHFRGLVGQDAQIPQGHDMVTLRISGVQAPDTVTGFQTIHGGRVSGNVQLQHIPAEHKVAFTTTMPHESRALYAALVAWKERKFEPFQRFVAMVGPLGEPLLEAAVERARAEQALRLEAAEVEQAAARARAREAARVRVEGTENTSWETFDENRIIRIQCDVVNDDPGLKSRMEDGEIQHTGLHYDLVVPKGYNDDVNRWYSVLFIASPGGNARMGKMANRLKRDGWIVVMLVESRNADKRWMNNFLAAHDDVVSRLRVAPGAKFATGMSGGARVVSAFPGLRPGFRGVILQAAGMTYGSSHDQYGKQIWRTYPEHTAVAMTMGDTDMNFKESHYLRILLNSDSPRLVDIWKGGHTWCPEDSFDRVLNWLEEVTFLQAPRPASSWEYFPKHRVEAEELHPVAYKWFYDLTLDRAKKAENPYHRYYHLSRLRTIALNGNLQRDPDVVEIQRQVETDLTDLSNDPQVMSGQETERLFRQFETTYADLERRIQRMDDPITQGFEFKLSAADLRIGEAALALGKKVVDNHPDTPQAAFLKGFLFGLEVTITK
ncbi:MAG: hypothetical protein WD708_05090 [Kiritimatiellia bacterium]